MPEARGHVNIVGAGACADTIHVANGKLGFGQRVNDDRVGFEGVRCYPRVVCVDVGEIKPLQAQREFHVLKLDVEVGVANDAVALLSG